MTQTFALLGTVALLSALIVMNTFASGTGLVLDARLQYKLNKQFTVAAGVDNLNNDKMFAYHPMPQRTWHAELKLDY